MHFQQLTSLFGIVALIGIAFALSKEKKQVKWRGVIAGMALQFGFAVIVLKTTLGRHFFDTINHGVMSLIHYQMEGARFVFNTLAIPPEDPESMGFFFAFQILTSIIFISSLMGVLYHLGVMQRVVMVFAKVMRKVTGTSGAESLSASANIFVGQSEAPLLIRPYIKDLTRSELLCVMVAGMATVSGAIMGAYVGMLKGFFPDIAAHVLAASVMSAPAALVVSKILLPETETPKTLDTLALDNAQESTNIVEAATSGAEMGLKLALIVGTMLIAFISLLALANGMLGGVAMWLSELTGFTWLAGLTIQGVLGYLFAPLAWLMGAPWSECLIVGQLIGEKTVLNEVVAYAHMGEMLRADPTALSDRSILIASYALCGFANILSIGIQIGGLSAIAPERKADLSKLGVLALVGGSLATFMTAAIAGVLIP